MPAHKAVVVLPGAVVPAMSVVQTLVAVSVKAVAQVVPLMQSLAVQPVMLAVKVEPMVPVMAQGCRSHWGTAPQLQGKCRAECRGPPPEAAECRDFAAGCRDFGRRASDFFGFCAPRRCG
jgi:hypothetical protein